MKNGFVLLGVAGYLTVLTVVSCGGARSGRGFHLPEGDAEKGRAAFVELGCNQCHTVAGVDLPAPTAPGPVQVKLGGQVFRVKTYGQLVTSIIDPSHIVSPQYREKLTVPMPDLTQAMTVRQMIDVVAFLHARYTKIHPEYRDYSYPYAPYGIPVYPGPSQSPH